MPASKYCFGFETLFRTTIVTSGPVVSINVRDDADADPDADTDLNADAASDLKYYSGRLPSPVLGKLGPGQLGPGQLGPGQLGPG